MAETAYIVLRRTRVAINRDDASPGNVNEQWEQVAEVKAASAESAVRLAVTSLNPADGAYVATPMRSWKPLTVTATTQTVLKLGAQPEPT